MIVAEPKFNIWFTYHLGLFKIFLKYGYAPFGIYSPQTWAEWNLVTFLYSSLEFNIFVRYFLDAGHDASVVISNLNSEIQIVLRFV